MVFTLIGMVVASYSAYRVCWNAKFRDGEFDNLPKSPLWMDRRNYCVRDWIFFTSVLLELTHVRPTKAKKFSHILAPQNS